MFKHLVHGHTIVIDVKNTEDTIRYIKINKLSDNAYLAVYYFDNDITSMFNLDTDKLHELCNHYTDCTYEVI